MTDERSMREELDELERRLAQREAELERLESTMEALEKKSASLLPEVRNPTMPDAIVVPPPEPVVVRDPAVVELLKQSAGMVQRVDHLRVTVENLDRKFETLARELVQYRREDQEKEAQRAQTGPGPEFDRKLRLLVMGLFFLFVLLIWLI